MSAIGQLWTYLNTHNNEELQRTDIIVMLKRVVDEHDKSVSERDAAIAAAVQAERERCAEDAAPFILSLKYGGDRNQQDLRELSSELAAAIRARGK